MVEMCRKQQKTAETRQKRAKNVSDNNKQKLAWRRTRRGTTKRTTKRKRTTKGKKERSAAEEDNLNEPTVPNVVDDAHDERCIVTVITAT